MRGIHWFRNDLRLGDNVALAALAGIVDEWMPVFVLDPDLLARHPIERPRSRFLLDCVASLERDLARRRARLVVVHGRPDRVLRDLARQLGAEWVSWNVASTPLGRRRDERVAAGLGRDRVRVLNRSDAPVFEADEIVNRAGSGYSVFTPFRRAWWERWDADPREAGANVRLPVQRSIVDESGTCVAMTRVATERPSALADALGRLEHRAARRRARPPSPNDASRRLQGGESAARRRLHRFLEQLIDRYESDRDRPDLDGTSRLSAHLRFGAISARRCFTDALAHAREHPAARPGVRKWLDELVWRDFYHATLVRRPELLAENLLPQYDLLPWVDDDRVFEAWKAGRTGYPFVDAGMRQLAATGWMHNRARMAVASFLTKHLLVDWRRGAEWFEAALVDADPASNRGGWQWAASTGTDAQPWFRIFNPVLQGRRFDPDGNYVRRWVPELRRLPSTTIHAPWKAGVPPRDYPPPIVEHEAARDRALAAYRQAGRRFRSSGTRRARK